MPRSSQSISLHNSTDIYACGRLARLSVSLLGPRQCETIRKLTIVECVVRPRSAYRPSDLAFLRANRNSSRKLLWWLDNDDAAGRRFHKFVMGRVCYQMVCRSVLFDRVNFSRCWFFFLFLSTFFVPVSSSGCFVFYHCDRIAWKPQKKKYAKISETLT